ncbi:lipopolysaccharide biosynthesis protein [Kitasatospora sp. NPDC085879]|uniref:lipopolysaccharide biosynthesis protein n=1 Tax=Kitasatospora sp. NPDC085879 TaxID=3154769 RepID=UPI003431818A
MARHRGRHARPPDQVYRSSFFLLASSVTTAGLGFLFWVVVARFYTPEQVGLATSLISATSLLAYLSMFGLNSTLVRFPAPAPARNGQITQAIALVATVSGAAALVYLAGLPLYGPKLLFVRGDLLQAGAFVLFCVCAAVNALTDSVFVSARLPQLNVLVDGLIQGLAKLALPVALVALGPFGVVASTGGGYLVAVLASLLLMHRRIGYRFDFRTRGTRLREQLGYSAASYTSSLLNLLPLMIVPLIVLERLGTAAAGYYYVAFQIAGMLHAVSGAVGEALFAEVSSDESRFGELLRRSARIIAAVQVPAVIAVAAGSTLLLRIFGPSYAARSSGLLTVLALCALAVALNTWASFGLKAARSMTHLILSNVLFAAVTIGLTAFWAPRGLIWVGLAWGVGNLLSGLYATAALLARRTSARRTPERPVPASPYPAPPHPVAPYPAPPHPAASYPSPPYPAGPYAAPPHSAPPHHPQPGTGASAHAVPPQHFRTVRPEEHRR